MKFVDRLLGFFTDFWVDDVGPPAWLYTPYISTEINEVEEMDPEKDIKTIALSDVTRQKRKYDRRLFLKIKLKNLRDKVTMIRHYEEEAKLRINRMTFRSTGDPSLLENIPAEKDLLHQMVSHRRADIRLETRATLLAYGYIRGRKYKEIELIAKPEPAYIVAKRIQRVAKMVNRYSVLSGAKKMQDTMEADIRHWMGLNAMLKQDVEAA
jgi:hypothetical protein